MSGERKIAKITQARKFSTAELVKIVADRNRTHELRPYARIVLKRRARGSEVEPA